ncbi:MAG: tRNA pseudouridine55 synthase [Candidatus Midichloriaceae bacterium]|jgi:tRNA pseudouridine55 synthase
MNGWLLVDKPKGITSFGVVNLIKKILKVKIGHCGTLDPFATGALLLAIGKATRLVEHAQNFEKSYEFSVKWGVATDSYDVTGKVTDTSSVIPSYEQIDIAMQKFIGVIDQTPPIFSAVKINGKRAYEYARKNEKVEIASKRVHLKEISILNHSDDTTKFKILSGKGFYVRSLAYDLARSLDTYAHVTDLRRNSTGILSGLKLLDIEELKKSLQIEGFYDYVTSNILPVDYVLDDIPVHNVDYGEMQRVQNGEKIQSTLSIESGSSLAVKKDSALIAICIYDLGYLKPKIVF